LPLFYLMICLYAILSLLWISWSNRWRYQALINENPTNFTYLTYFFALFVIQITAISLIPTPYIWPIIAVIFISLILGVCFSLLIAKRLYFQRFW
jgi:CHASE2 domain-containing sensor protein